MNNKPSIADRAKAIAARVWPMMSQDHVAESVAAFGEELYREGQNNSDSLWYDAMKWAGLDGLMRSKINMRVVLLRSQIVHEAK